jgi:hypothetical protein
MSIIVVVVVVVVEAIVRGQNDDEYNEAHCLMVVLIITIFCIEELKNFDMF